MHPGAPPSLSPRLPCAVRSLRKLKSLNEIDQDRRGSVGIITLLRIGRIRNVPSRPARTAFICRTFPLAHPHRYTIRFTNETRDRLLAGATTSHFGPMAVADRRHGGPIEARPLAAVPAIGTAEHGNSPRRQAESLDLPAGAIASSVVRHFLTSSSLCHHRDLKELLKWPNVLGMQGGELTKPAGISARRAARRRHGGANRGQRHHKAKRLCQQ